VSDDSQEVFETICRALRVHAGDEAKITRETMILADLEIDSVDVFDMIMEVEDAFDISIPMEVIGEVQSVGELTDAVVRLRKG